MSVLRDEVLKCSTVVELVAKYQLKDLNILILSLLVSNTLVSHIFWYSDHWCLSANIYTKTLINSFRSKHLSLTRNRKQ